MVDGLNDHRIDDIGEFFLKVFVGLVTTVAEQGWFEEFQDNWQRPFQAAFSNKVC